MSYEIEGLTPEVMDSVETSSFGKSFPFETGKWLNFTAEVEAMEISNNGKYLIIKARNGEYSEWMYISITPPQQGALDGYHKRMTRLLKTFSIYSINTRGYAELDVNKLDQTTGMLFRFGTHGAVDEVKEQLYNDKGFPIVNFSISGPADSLTPIAPQAAGGGRDNDIPF
jgi:hypothetical protein